MAAEYSEKIMNLISKPEIERGEVLTKSTHVAKYGR